MVNGDQVIQVGTALTYVVAAIFGAFVGVGFTAGAFVVFLRSILNSPAVITLLEGIVESFPAETKELIDLLGQLLDKLSDGIPTQIELLPADDEPAG
jgi:hypothetical protein